jgi:hypothetical protein
MASPELVSAKPSSSSFTRWTVSTGTVTLPEFEELINHFLLDLGAIGSGVHRKDDAILQYNVGYYHGNDAHTAYGVHFTYERFRYHYFRRDTEIGSLKNYYYSANLSIRQYWLWKRRFHLYSGIDLGVMAVRSRTSGEVVIPNGYFVEKPTGQLVIIGLEVGRNVFFSFEIGFGVRGMLSPGVSFDPTGFR